MKKLFLVISMSLLVGASSVFAQSSKAVTPAKTSAVRRAIVAVVKKKFPKAARESLFKVQGNWARVVYGDTNPAATDVNVILKKTGKNWKIVWDYNANGEEGIDVNDYIKGVPKDIAYPWGS